MGGGGWVSRGLVRAGHGKGDIVIAMLYGTISRQDLVAMTKISCHENRLSVREGGGYIDKFRLYKG